MLYCICFQFCFLFYHLSTLPVQKLCMIAFLVARAHIYNC